ncbi:MAG: DUF2147 domain-containing protein [Verrucomicrobia bacterium]|nr:DUF2147 domain-containing protein [Verrucomicrobiota bacterium]
MSRFGILFVLTALLSFASKLFAAENLDAARIVGVWKTANDRGEVELTERAGKIFAKILTLKEPNFPANDKKGMAGKPKVDRENPDPKLRDRPLAGLEILRDLKSAGAGKWDGGHVYDPETGSTYKCKLTLVSTNKIEMRGFLGISLIGKTTTWTR